MIRRASLIVADMADEVSHDTGDLIAATRDGVEFAHKLHALADLIGQRVPGRRSPEDIVVYKSVGSALQDVATAEMLLERARMQGVGTVLPVSIAPVKK